MTTKASHIKLEITSEHNGMRLDKLLAILMPDYSRNQIQCWIKDAHVSINNKVCQKPKTLVNTDEIIVINIPETLPLVDEPEDIALSIAHEDEALLIINKPAGLVVHPGAGNRHGTLLNALLFYHPELSQLPRAGIIHRLDKDTSGLMMIAKSQPAFHKLTQALALRHIKRYYFAIVKGTINSAGTIDEPIGRHKVHRQKMAVTHNGKPAQTSWEVTQRLQGHSALHLTLHTGRTHQIRVHMQHLGHALLGDQTYNKAKPVMGLAPALQQSIRNFPRQALHAYELHLQHPISDKTLEIKCDLPQDIQEILNLLA